MKPYLLSFCVIITSALWIALHPLGASAASGRVAQKDSLQRPAATPNDLSVIQDWVFEGAGDGDEMGFSVSGAGDVNNDGFDDIIVGSPLFTTTGPDGVYREGAAFVFYGAAGGLKPVPDWITGGGVQGIRYGASVSAAGDVNHDGYDDVLVGAEYYKLPFDGYTGEQKSGAAFLYYGSENGLSASPDWEFYAEAPEIAFGFSVAVAGDIDHDGFDDILVGAPRFESTLGFASGGKVYLFQGSSTGPSLVPDWTYQCILIEASCGYALSAAGDVNNDSYGDIIIGAPHYDSPEPDEGAALFFFGGPAGPADTPDWIVEGDQPDAWFGVAVATAGDINQDGFSDLVVGSSHYNKDQDHNDTGAAFVYLGSPDGPALTPDWVAYGPEEYSGFGRSVAAAGDINRDGFADILIGAYKYGQNGAETQPDEGAAYIFKGGPTGAQSYYSWSVYGDKAETEFGFSVAAAGDVNGDGGADILIGAPQYKFDEKTVMGRAFVYLNSMTTEYTNNQVFIPLIFNPK